jgi:hypothetical protein
MADLRDIYLQNKAAIDEIDVQLDSLQDKDSVGKRKVGNQLIEAAKDHWEEWLAGVVKQLEEMEPEVRAGVQLAISRGLNEKFNKSTQELIASKVVDMPKTEPLITQDEATELSKVRSGLYAQLKSVVELAVSVGDAEEDSDDWKMPKIRRGAHGKRGKRALTLYTWYFNGEEVEDVDTTKDAAKYLGFEKSADFTKALRDSGVNTTNPPDEFTWTSPSGVVVTAQKDTDDSDDENEDEEVSEEE